MRFSVLSLIYPSSVSQEASGNEDIRIRKPGSVYYLLNSGDCSLYIDPGGRVHSQACLTLYDPMDCSPPGSSVHGDSASKNTRVDSHFLLKGIS